MTCFQSDKQKGIAEVFVSMKPSHSLPTMTDNEVFIPILSWYLVKLENLKKIKAQPQCIINGRTPSLAWCLIVKSSNLSNVRYYKVWTSIGFLHLVFIVPVVYFLNTLKYLQTHDCSWLHCEQCHQYKIKWATIVGSPIVWNHNNEFESVWIYFHLYFYILITIINHLIDLK